MTEDQNPGQEDEEILAFPASFAQQRLWFVDQLEPGRAVYNIPYQHQVRMRGPLDVAVLQRAVTALVERHETLRTTFTTVEGEPVQFIRDQVDTTMPIIDLTHLQGEAQDTEMRRIVQDESRHSFDLATGPLFYTKLLKLGDQDHVFIQMMSHIVVDGMSVEFVCEELEQLYEAFAAGKPSPLEELPLQYPDFVIWHREWMESAVPKKQLEYWKERLAGRLPVMELPTDRPRQAVQRNRGSWEWVNLPPNLIDSLKDLSKAEGVSLYMTMLAGFKVLLHRYTGQDDILVGTPTASRNQPELEKLIAFFVNPVVVRSELSDDAVFTDFLKEVRSSALGALANQDIPFERLVEELRPDRNLSHNPLFQVSFTLQMEPPLLQLPGTTVEPVEFDNGTAKFDLLTELWEADGGVSGRFEYDTDLFDRSTILRMIDNYETVLRSVAAGPSKTLGQFSVVADAETEQVKQWNDTAVDYDRNATLHGLIEASAAARPDCVAVTDGNETLTYSQLNARANQLARHLQSNGVTRGDTVGISVSRTAEMLVGLLGVMKVGGAYLPLDPDYPRDRLDFIIGDAKAKLLITERDLADRWASFDGPTVTLDGDRETLSALDTANVDGGVTPEDLVYVIHTSGSTGLPKGVQVTHGNVVNFLTSMADKPGLTDADVLLAVTTLSFDIAVLELYLPLLVGGTVFVAGPDVQSSGEALASTMVEHSVTAMQATPATWKLLLNSGWDGKADLTVLCGGELLPRELAEELIPRCSALWNMYGPTETTVWSAAKQVHSGDGPVPIGEPIANTELHILDQNLQPVPIGVPGELCIGGEGVTDGYLDRPELNEDRFVPDPFTTRDPSTPGRARLYRTGDLCRYRPDGTIEFLGRIDLQVKVRGFRIELGEIETVLGRSDAVKEAVVTAQPDPSGDSRLVAYVVPVDDGAGSDAGSLVVASDLREHLSQSLPSYMVPTLFVPMVDWPLTNNGKIDRRALPAPEDAELSAGGERIAPRNQTEERVAEIWSGLLGVTDIGVEDNFFELGGHSLLAAQIIAQVNEAFDVVVPLAELFANPVVAHLAEQVATATLLADAPEDDGADREEFIL